MYKKEVRVKFYQIEICNNAQKRKFINIKDTQNDNVILEIY